MAKKMETKYFPFTLTKYDEKEGTFSGYASIFGVVDSYNEVVDAGAFTKTLKERKSRTLFWSHDSYRPGVGRTEPVEDKIGLRLDDARLYLDIALAKDIYINMKNGTLDGLSIGYKTMDEWVDPVTRVRHLKEIALWEISLCNFQACPGAVVFDVKSIGPGELKPFPSEHSCRLRDPDDFQQDSFKRMTRKHEDKEYSVIMGKLEGEETMTEQSYRYKKEIWTAAEAKAHCVDHDGSFEAAKGKCVGCTALLDGGPDSTTPLDEESQDTSKSDLLHSLEELIGKARELNL